MGHGVFFSTVAEDYREYSLFSQSLRRGGDASPCNKPYIDFQLLLVARTVLEGREEKGYAEVCSRYAWRTCGSGAAGDSAVPRGCSSSFLAAFHLHLPKGNLCGTEGLSSKASSQGS